MEVYKSSSFLASGRGGGGGGRGDEPEVTGDESLKRSRSVLDGEENVLGRDD